MSVVFGFRIVLNLRARIGLGLLLGLWLGLGLVLVLALTLTLNIIYRSDSTASLTSHCTLSHIDFYLSQNVDIYDETDAGPPCGNITDLFPVGTECFMLAVPHYGSSGKVCRLSASNVGLWANKIIKSINDSWPEYVENQQPNELAWNPTTSNHIFSFNVQLVWRFWLSAQKSISSILQNLYFSPFFTNFSIFECEIQDSIYFSMISTC